MEDSFGLVSWQSIAATILIYYVALALQRLYLHPLSQFPGPKLAAVTRLYEGYYDLYQNGQYTFKIAELHKRYGKKDMLWDPAALLIIWLTRTHHPHQPLRAPRERCGIL